MRGVSAAGAESAVSRVVSAIVKADPLAPIGALRVLHGPRTDDSDLDLAIDLYGDDDPNATEMRLAWPGTRGASFDSYEPLRTIALRAVGEPTSILVHATLRDVAGNESPTYVESILQYPPGSLGSIRGTAHRSAGGDADLRVRIGSAPGEAVVLTGADGSFVLDDLLPGTYTIEVLGDGVSGRVTGVAVDPGEQTDVGSVLVPEPGAGAGALAALAALAGAFTRRAARVPAARPCDVRPRPAARR